MYITVDSSGASLQELNNLKTFKVVSTCSPEKAGSVVARAGVGRLVDNHVEVELSYLLAAAAKSGFPADWATDFERMVDFAGSQGWVTTDGAIVAHVEWHKPEPAFDP